MKRKIGRHSFSAHRTKVSSWLFRVYSYSNWAGLDIVLGRYAFMWSLVRKTQRS